MGTFENTVKLNTNSILGKIIEKVKNKVNLDSDNWGVYTFDKTKLVTGSNNINYHTLTAPMGYKFNKIEIFTLLNKVTTDASSTYFSVDPTSAATSTGIIQYGDISASALAIATFNKAIYSKDCGIMYNYGNYRTASTKLTNITSLTLSQSKSFNVNTSNYDLSKITFSTNVALANIDSLAVTIRYQLEKI